MDFTEQLNHIFCPAAVAVVGASANPDKLGGRCLRSLLKAGFKGKIYPVNPGLSELFGLQVYPSVRDIPGEVDLAIIAIPAELTIPVVEECVDKGVKGALLITSGYKEVGTEIGLDLQDKIRDIANQGGMKIIGPNTAGLINPGADLNATFFLHLSSVKAGGVAVASQSGGILNYIVTTLMRLNVGISKGTGLGNRCNLDFDEVVTFFAEDEETRVIVLYIEGLEHPRRLMEVARQVVKRKPIVVYKSGRGGGLNRASLSHTGTLAGKYELYKAAFAQAGMINVHDMNELVDTAKALDLQPPQSGNRVAIVSIQAGSGIIMGDRCYELGLRLAEFSSTTQRKLRRLLAPFASVGNPVDVGGLPFGDFDTPREILKCVMEDDNVDMVAANLVELNPGIGYTAAILEMPRYYRKPMVVSCSSSFTGKDLKIIAEIERNHVPVYPLPERAITGLAGLVRYGKILKGAG